MEREKFMQEARRTVHQILESKANGIMNLVQQAWAEGKRNAEVEALRAAIDEASDKRESLSMMEDLDGLKDPEYPTWWKYLCVIGIIPDTLGDKTLGEVTVDRLMSIRIPADIAEKLKLEPK